MNINKSVIIILKTGNQLKFRSCIWSVGIALGLLSARYLEPISRKNCNYMLSTSTGRRLTLISKKWVERCPKETIWMHLIMTGIGSLKASTVRKLEKKRSGGFQRIAKDSSQTHLNLSTCEHSPALPFPRSEAHRYPSLCHIGCPHVDRSRVYRHLSFKSRWHILITIRGANVPTTNNVSGTHRFAQNV